jgi:fructoselysine-6-P-deglycase FrlB-like protein
MVGLRVPSKFDIWYKGLNLLDSTVLPEETIYLLGNRILYAIALYTSLKISEFFGTTAVAHRLEEFCHSPIFGIKKPHHLWIMGQNDELISQRLKRLGLHLSYVRRTL